MNQSANPAPSPSSAPAALYQQVKAYIARQIQSGAWQPGDRVPSEQELVNRFSVSRMTVNRALRELQAEGLVERAQGVGTFAAPLRTDDPRKTQFVRSPRGASAATTPGRFSNRNPRTTA